MRRARRVKTCCSASMTYSNDLIEALRRELQQYGEVLARFDDAAANNNPDSEEQALVWVEAIREQERILGLTLRKREHVQRQVAHCLGLPEQASLTRIIPLLPRQHQLLVRALSDENKELSARVQRRADQKRQVLQHLLHLMESCFTGRSTQPVQPPAISPGLMLPASPIGPCPGLSSSSWMPARKGLEVLEGDPTRLA